VQRPHVRGCAGHQDDRLRFVAVEEAACHGGVTGIGDLRLDRAGAIRQLSKRRRRAGHGDHRGAGRGDGRGDPAAQAAARTDDERGPA
jgi:hypothetical protein